MLSDPVRRQEYLAELEAGDHGPPQRADSDGAAGTAAPASRRPSSYPGGLGFYPDAPALHVPCERCHFPSPIL